LPEAVLWTGGSVVVHVVGGFLVAAALVVVHIIRMAGDATQVTASSIESFIEQQMVNILGGEQLLFAAAAVMLAALRLRPEIDRRLALGRLPSLRHIGLILLLVVPLSVLCSSLYARTDEAWSRLQESVPALKPLGELQTMEVLEPLAEDGPLGLLLIIIALAPAIGEEFVFRGVIGRGLVARWGVCAGVLLTSCLFGLMHLYPPHIVSVIPLGIAMHALYLLTRSFWAPVLLHFCNNAWSVVAMRGIESSLADSVSPDKTGAPWELQLAAAGLVAAGFWLLWQTRVRYLLPDGSLWTPAYATAEMPPAAAEARAFRARPTSAAAATYWAAGTVFLAVLANSLP
jgi:hypothetical protein